MARAEYSYSLPQTGQSGNDPIDIWVPGDPPINYDKNGNMVGMSDMDAINTAFPSYTAPGPSTAPATDNPYALPQIGQSGNDPIDMYLSSLVEFQLAGKALDTYLDLVKKAKARVEKSGEVEPGLDDDSTALHTAAAGIKMFCNYGRRQDVERAQEIAVW